MNRRQLLTSTMSCGAHLLALSTASSVFARSVFAPQDVDAVVAQEKWARVEKIHDGIFAIISTPFETKDYSTVCNGGIIVGSRSTLVVEAFMQPKGAEWVGQQSKKLGGRQPTDVVVTHYHGDHSSGHKGFGTEDAKPDIWLTDSIKKQAENSFRQSGADNAFAGVKRLSSEKPTEIDLGDRTVKLVPRSGHTNSDITIEIDDPKVVFCGDLFFNRMFPNYLDATPTTLKKFVSTMAQRQDVTYVPGHGPIAKLEDLKLYGEFLAFVETSATDAFQAGKTVAEGAKEFALPQSLSDWLIWSPAVVGRAYAAWYRELKGKSPKD